MMEFSSQNQPKNKHYPVVVQEANEFNHICIDSTIPSRSSFNFCPHWFRIQCHANAAAGFAAADVEYNTTIRLCHRLLDRPCAIPKYQYLIHSLPHHRKNCKTKWNKKQLLLTVKTHFWGPIKTALSSIEQFTFFLQRINF